MKLRENKEAYLIFLKYLAWLEDSRPLLAEIIYNDYMERDFDNFNDIISWDNKSINYLKKG